MRIIHINTQKKWRGGERQLTWLYEEIQKKGIEQILICKKKSELEVFSIQNKIQFKSFSIEIYTLFYVAFKVIKFIKKEETIVHCHDSKSHTIALILKLFYRSKVKVVVQRKVNFPIKGFFSKKIKYSEKYINAIFCVSKSVESTILKSTGFKNTIVIYDMVKPIEFQLIIHSKSRFQIGYIAALTYEKDHFTFLNTAKNILKTYPNIQFIIAGEGKLKTKLIDYTAELGITNKVDFVGFIKDIPSLIAQIDILLFTSTSEGLGSTILDFFIAKKPVVTVKNGGSEELVFHNKTGFICELKDDVNLSKYCVELIKNPELMHKITENSFKFVTENFSADIITEKILDAYTKILKNKSVVINEH